MQNNRIYVDGRLIDATQLTDGQWEYLVAANRDSTKRRLVKCAWCWQEDHATHWKKTYSKADGTRIVSHQAGESGDHPGPLVAVGPGDRLVDGVGHGSSSALKDSSVWKGRTSTLPRHALEPSAARRSATSRSGASMTQKPPRCSLASR